MRDRGELEKDGGLNRVIQKEKRRKKRKRGRRREISPKAPQKSTSIVLLARCFVLKESFS